MSGESKGKYIAPFISTTDIKVELCPGGYYIHFGLDVLILPRDIALGLAQFIIAREEPNAVERS